MELLQLILRKKYIVFIIVFSSMGAAFLYSRVKPPTYKAEVMLLIFSPYNPNNNSNLPSYPYSKLCNDLFYRLNFKSIVIEAINKKHPQANILQNDFDKIASIEFLDKSNWASIKVSHPSSQISMDLANIIAESFVTQINETLNLEFVEIDKTFEKELNELGKELWGIEESLKNLQLSTDFQLLTNVYNKNSSQLPGYKSQMRDLEISFDGIEKKISELARQLKEEEANTPQNQGAIDRLKSNINAQRLEEATKLSEIKVSKENIFKLEKEIEGLNQKLVQYNSEKIRLDRERAIVEPRLRSMTIQADHAKLEAKSKQISAKILEFPKEPQLVENDFNKNMVWAGAGSLIFSIIFLWLFFL